ncbi:MAG: hypothetical protein ACOVS5_12495 [Oligoflexus sp.]|jgi:hypothetical protein
MNLLARQDLVSRSRLVLHDWRLRPNTGRFWKDVIFLFIVVFIQTTVGPTLLGKFGFIDLMTPWIVITAIRQRPLQVILLTSLAAFLLETRLAVPAGLYLCAYWILCNILIQIRPALSWRYRTPWFVCYTGSALWILLFESFVLHFLQPGLLTETSYVIHMLIRVLVAAGFGMYLSREWMNIDAEEPVPQ